MDWLRVMPGLWHSQTWTFQYKSVSRSPKVHDRKIPSDRKIWQQSVGAATGKADGKLQRIVIGLYRSLCKMFFLPHRFMAKFRFKKHSWPYLRYKVNNLCPQIFFLQLSDFLNTIFLSHASCPAPGSTTSLLPQPLGRPPVSCPSPWVDHQPPAPAPGSTTSLLPQPLGQPPASYPSPLFDIFYCGSASLPARQDTLLGREWGTTASLQATSVFG